MDIGKMSIAFSLSQVKQQASLSLMNKVMDQANGNGEFIDKMMQTANFQDLQRAAQPHLGGSIDVQA